MKVIRNNIIPFKGYKAINLFGILFVRKGARISDVDINHEAIHTAQMRELLYIPFYIIYGVEWLGRVLTTNFMNPHKAYRNISFEVEAYSNESDLDYLPNRKHYAQWRG